METIACQPVNLSTCQPVNLSTCQPSSDQPVNLQVINLSTFNLSTCQAVNAIDRRSRYAIANLELVTRVTPIYGWSDSRYPENYGDYLKA
ncbi:MAG: hypothetical protein F6K44_26630, partial [Moorea sp. SIO3E2]|nr:hypothetical protein [Moorena sp. SIO3E2]